MLNLDPENHSLLVLEFFGLPSEMLHKIPGFPSMARLTKFALTCAILASLTSFLAGLQYGELGNETRDFFMENNERKIETFLTFSSIFHFLAPLPAGTLPDLIGRRYSLLLSPIFLFFGSLVTSLAPNYVVFVAGYLLFGTGISFALAVTHVYITELSPDCTRGFLTTFPEVFWSIGYLVDNTFPRISPKKILIWRLRLGTIPSFLLAFAMLFTLPESPGWLVTRGKLTEATRVLTKTSVSEEEAKLRLGEIKLAAESKHSGWTGSSKKLLLHPSPSIRRALIAVVGLNFFRSSTGIEAVNLFSSRLLEMAGIKDQGDILGVTSVVGFIKIGIILTAGFTMDKIRRRPLLLVSAAGMILSLAGLGFGLTIFYHSDEKLIWAVDLGVAMAFLCAVFFSTGLGPVTWVYSSEAFPLRLRAQGASLEAAVNLGTRGLTSLVFISSYGVITFGGAFLLFAGVASVAWLFFYKLLPETHGKSLEEKEIGRGSVVGTSDDAESSNLDGRVAGSGRLDGHEIPFLERKLHKKSASFPVNRPSSSVKIYVTSNINQL